jgi:hypothetical protein
MYTQVHRFCAVFTAKHNIKQYIDETLPGEYEKYLVGLNAITKEARNTAHNTETIPIVT